MPKMEYRKIQLTGDSTYIISLPKAWIKKNNLDKGEVLSVIEKGSELNIRIKEERERDTTILIKTKDENFLARLLITKYIQGFDTITFKSRDSLDPFMRQRLIRESSFLIGLEPFGETKETITFKMLMKSGRKLIESFERMQDLSMLSLRELLDELESGDYDENMLSGIVQRDDEIDKFYFLILRQLSSTSGFEAIIWAQIAKSIERISDHVERIAQAMIEGKIPKKESLVLYKPLMDMYSDVMLTVKTGNLSMAEKILIDIQEFRRREQELESILEDSERKNILVYASFRRIGDYISDIAESVINLS